MNPGAMHPSPDAHPTPAAIVGFLLKLHSSPSPASSASDSRARSILATAVDRARLGAYMATRLMQTGALLCLRLTGWRHPLGWKLDQELLVMLLYGLLSSGRTRSWRRFFRMVASHSQDAVNDLQLQQVRTGRCDSWWMRLPPHLQPQQPRGRVRWLYLHGGAFVAGHPLMYASITRYWLQHLAAQGIHAEILSVDYPLAPEHPFPEALLAAGEAYQWLLQQRCPEGTVVVAGGDSAGGNLVLGALSHLRQQGALPAPPHAALLISPAVDISDTAVFYRPTPRAALWSTAAAEAAGCYDYIPRAAMANGRGGYVQEHQSPRDPLVSPTYTTDWHGLVGPGGLLVVAGGAEVMRPDIAAFAAKAAAAAPYPVVYHEEPGEPHCYPCLELPQLRPKCHRMLDFLADAAATEAARRAVVVASGRPTDDARST